VTFQTEEYEGCSNTTHDAVAVKVKTVSQLKNGTLLVEVHSDWKWRLP
jgi:hypothetical protein